jgi:hypothetical protein
MLCSPVSLSTGWAGRALLGTNEQSGLRNGSKNLSELVVNEITQSKDTGGPRLPPVSPAGWAGISNVCCLVGGEEVAHFVPFGAHISSAVGIGGGNDWDLPH